MYDTRRNPWNSHPVIYNTDNPYSIRFGASPYAGYFQNATPRAVQGNLPGNFFAPVPMPQYQPQVPPVQNQLPPPTQNQPYYQPTPIINNNPNAARDLWSGITTAYNDYVVPQLPQIGAQVAGILATGGLGGAAVRMGAPYALATLGTYKYGRPIANGIIKAAETPVGKRLGEYADKASNFIDLFF